MTAEEFILDKWNSCTMFTHLDRPNQIIMIYDPGIIRQKKMNSLSCENKEIVYKKSLESKVLFVQNYMHNELEVDIGIYNILMVKYNFKYENIRTIITDVILLEYNKENKLIPHVSQLSLFDYLLNDTRLTLIT